MADVSELIRAALTSHFIGGAAGGMVRGLTMQESIGVVSTRTLAGGCSAHYIAPILLWWLPKLVELTQEDLVSIEQPAAYFIAFFTGMSGMFIANITEKLIKQRLGVKDE